MQAEKNGKWYKLIYLKKRSRVTYVENLWEKEGGTQWEVGVDVLTNIYKITNKDLLYSIRNSSQYSVMTYLGKHSKKEWIMYN